MAMRWLRRMGSKLPKISFCCIVLFITVCAASSNSGGASAAAFRRGRFLSDDADGDISDVDVFNEDDVENLGGKADTGVDENDDGDDNGQEYSYEIDWMAVFMNLGGGISFFLYGLKKMGAAIRDVAGTKMKEILKMMTANEFVGFLSGMFITGLSNSLTLTSVLVVEFVASDLMPFERCIGVLMGAGVGSTFIGLLMAFKITKYGLLLVTLSYCVMLFDRKPKAESAPRKARANFDVEAESLMSDKTSDAGDDGDDSTADYREAIAAYKRRQAYAAIVFGLGMIFHGSELMSSAFAFLKTNKPFLKFLASLENPFVGVVAGAIVTIIVQSSGASLGIYMSLAQQGLLSVSAGIAMALGANVGTCLTSLLTAASSSNRGALQAAVALLLARVVGSLFFAVFIGLLQWLSAMVCGLDGVKELTYDQMASEIAAAHTLFNFLLALVVLPLSTYYAVLVKMLVPSKS